MAPISQNNRDFEPVITITDAIAEQLYSPPILWDPSATLDIGTVQDSNAHEHPVSVVDMPVISTPNNALENENLSHYSPRGLSSLAPRDFGQQSKADQAADIIALIFFGLVTLYVAIPLIGVVLAVIIYILAGIGKCCCGCDCLEDAKEARQSQQSQSNTSTSTQSNTSNTGETPQCEINSELPAYQHSIPNQHAPMVLPAILSSPAA